MGEVVVRRVDLAQRQRDAAARQVLEEIDGELLRRVTVPGAGPLDHVERPERAGLGRQHDAVPAEAAPVLQRRGHQPLDLGAVADGRDLQRRDAQPAAVLGPGARVEPDRRLPFGPAVLGLGVAGADAVPDLVEARERVELLGARDDHVVVAASATGGRGAERRLQPEAEGLGIDRHDHVAVGGDRVLDRRDRIAAVAEQLRADQRLLGAERGAGERHPGVPARRRRAVDRLERERHLRPRALRACHRRLHDFSGLRLRGCPER